MAEHMPPRKPGRPRVPTPGSAVSTWLPPAAYDKLIKAAKAQDVTISYLLREWLEVKLK
jgi:hypothetical protein